MFDISPARLLFDRYRLRRIRQTIDRDVDDFVVNIEDDPERSSLVANPFESMDDVRDRLKQLESLLLDQSDRRAVFLTVYAEMTAETIRAIEADEFIDPVWMEQYLIRFAEYYRRAFRNYERGAFAEVPDPWIVAFGTALRGDELVIQDALLGINAHINYDLALALSDLGLNPDRSDKYADHNRVNEILHRLVSVQQELLSRKYASGLSRIGDQLGQLDDAVASLGLRRAREKAWQVAVVRSDFKWLPIEGYTRWLLERTATGGAYLLVQPKASPETIQMLRDIESDQLSLPAVARDFHNHAQTRFRE